MFDILSLFLFISLHHIKNKEAKAMKEFSSEPRHIDCAATFEALVQWVYQQAQEENAPGVIIGISGTDSILTFLVCAEAFKRLGKQDRVIGVHYGLENGTISPAPQTESIVCVKDTFNWVAHDILPWLREQAPDAIIEIDSREGYDDDNIRWGRLFSRAVAETENNQGLTNKYYFPVGTHNATEAHLGTYSQISKAVSMEPIIDVYKSEVLALCRHLSVPQIALDKSREIDCACGRYDVAANHIEEVDAYIMIQKQDLDRSYLDTIPMEVVSAVMEYVIEEQERNRFRQKTPYRPQKSLIVV